MNFTEMKPIMVNISIIPFSESGASIVCSWEAKGKILGIDHNFGSYRKSYEDTDIVFMRRYQDIDAIGFEFDSPLGKIYVAIMSDKETVWICDAVGSIKEFPIEFEIGEFFIQSFIENDINKDLEPAKT